MNIESLKGVLNLLGSAFPFQDEASKTAFHDAVNNLDSDTEAAPIAEVAPIAAAPEPEPETPAPEAAVETPAVEDGPVAEAPASEPTGPGMATAEAPADPAAETSVDAEIAAAEARLADLKAQKAQS